ncbi:MAG: sodium:proton antiporter, partial [Clostridia bacterium]|nr:sodium:proton antiporter [Clostridia bacterium]
GHENPTAAFVFTAGAMSMIGVPMFAGFIPKLLYATAAFDNGFLTYVILVALAVSTMLNVAYFLRTVLTIYTPKPTHEMVHVRMRDNVGFVIVGVLLVALNVYLGLHAQPVIDLFERGIALFISVR